MSRFTPTFVLAFALLFVAGSKAVERVEQKAIRQAIQRSLQFIEKEGTKWIERRKCVSCHQIPAMLWSMNEAQRHGLYSKKTELTKWNEWSLQWENWDQPTKSEKEPVVARKNIETMTNLILAGSLSPEKPEEKKLLKLYVQRIIKSQNANGSWKPNGQLPLQKRSKAESQQVTTLWAVLALEISDEKSKAVTQSRDRALAWLSKAPKGISTEWYVAWSLVQRQLGKTKEADRLLKALVSKQQKDGGWGWLLNDKSDAFGTGMVLYALAQAGWKPGHEVVRRAQRFLISTQEKDGS